MSVARCAACCAAGFHFIRLLTGLPWSLGVSTDWRNAGRRCGAKPRLLTIIGQAASQLEGASQGRKTMTGLLFPKQNQNLGIYIDDLTHPRCVASTAPPGNKDTYL